MRFALALSALLLGVCAPSYADTIFMLDNATFADGSSALGTIAVNTKTGVVDNFKVTYTSATGTTSLFKGMPSGQGASGGIEYYAYANDAAGDALLLDIPGISLIGYAGGNLCSTSNNCGGPSGFFQLSGSSTQNVLATGSLVPTPEPSSIIMLGTGLIGIAGATRRRFARSSN